MNVDHVHAVPTKARRGHHIPLGLGLWTSVSKHVGLRIGPGSSGGATSALNLSHLSRLLENMCVHAHMSAYVYVGECHYAHVRAEDSLQEPVRSFYHVGLWSGT